MKASGIGGQAVLEGIMMRNKDKYSVAVRKPDKEIIVDIKNCKDTSKRCKLFKLPFIRGIFNFVDSLVIGIKTLTYSAEFYEDEEEVVEKPVDKVTRTVFKEKAESFLMGITVLVSILFSVLLFIVSPYFISELLKNTINIRSNTILAIVEGILRIIIFILYMFLISRMKDIQRTFMYHGAEHKCINCIEHGFELNLENVKASSRIHKRCGTSFLFFVMFISIVCFILVSALLPKDISVLVKVITRLLLVPIIAGISYEILRAAGKHDNFLLNIISKPGMWMQKLSTKEPDDDMIEVGIKAVEAVFDWQEFLAENKEEFGRNENSKTNEAAMEDDDNDFGIDRIAVDFDDDDDDISEFKSKADM